MKEFTSEDWTAITLGLSLLIGKESKKFKSKWRRDYNFYDHEAFIATCIYPEEKADAEILARLWELRGETYEGEIIAEKATGKILSIENYTTPFIK